MSIPSRCGLVVPIAQTTNYYKPLILPIACSEPSIKTLFSTIDNKNL